MTGYVAFDELCQRRSRACAELVRNNATDAEIEEVVKHFAGEMMKLYQELGLEWTYHQESRHKAQKVQDVIRDRDRHWQGAHEQQERQRAKQDNRRAVLDLAQARQARQERQTESKPKPEILN